MMQYNDNKHRSDLMTSRNVQTISRSSSKSSLENSDDYELYKKQNSTAWVPPNDRELIIRAKLKTGWSSRLSALSNLNKNNPRASSGMRSRLSVSRSAGIASTTTASAAKDSPSSLSTTTSNGITDAEFIEIEHVLKRANMVEQKELDRISKLLQRYQAMNRPQGNGETTCFICNCNFGILGATPRICSDCLKNVCQTCSIDSLSTNKQCTIWLCRICAEYRDFLKKSGVWWSKRLPPLVAHNNGQTSTGITPSNSNLSNSNSIKSDDVKFQQKSFRLDKQKQQREDRKKINLGSGVRRSSSDDGQSSRCYSDDYDDDEVATIDEEARRNPFLSPSEAVTDIIVTKAKNTGSGKTVARLNQHRSSMDNHNRSDFDDNDVDEFGGGGDEDNRSSDGYSTSRNYRSHSEALPSISISQQGTQKTSSKQSTPVANMSSITALKDDTNNEDKPEETDDGQTIRHKSISIYPSSKQEIMSSFDPNIESRLIQEQMAHLRPGSANLSLMGASTNIANSTAISPSIPPPPLQLPFKQIATDNNNNTNKLAYLGDDSSNISLAFNNYRPTRTTNSNLGHLQFSVEYIPSQLQLKIDLLGATDLPAKDSNGLSDPYVKLHLLPGIAKATKLRSKTIYKNLNPHFNETFHYDGVTLQDLDAKTLRLTVLDEDKFGFDFIGEYRLPLKTLIINEVNHFNVALEEKLKNDDELDLTSRGKINFALKYSKQNSCLFVKINRCTQLLPMDNGKSSDPFVEVSIMPSLKEGKSKFKTSVKKKTLDPEFFEEFKFTNVDLRSLLTKTIEICVWDKDFRKNDFIGLVQLGQNRSGDELKHFFTMIKNPELYHEQWHTLHLRSIDGSSDSL